ncbi:MAG: peptidase C39 family protein, partial [Hamadaea sp.]|nr:peptidase C39 family protein [Hamadaea sp.]
VNDPASASDSVVVKTVGRAEWEAAWQTTSRGVVYVITPPGRALPTPPAQANW